MEKIRKRKGSADVDFIIYPVFTFIQIIFVAYSIFVSFLIDIIYDVYKTL